LPGDAARGIREERRQVRADRLAGEEEDGQDSVELRAVVRLGQVPRSGAVDVAVRLVRDLPDRLGGTAEVEVFQCLGDQAGSSPDGPVESGRVTRLPWWSGPARRGTGGSC
jgi:hypothetical protein